MRVAVVALATLLCSSLSPALAADQWQQFSDPDGAFVVEVPQAPVIKHETTELDDHKLPKAQYLVDLGDVALMVRIGDYTTMPLDPEGAVTAGAQGAVEGQTLISNVIETLDGHAGRSVKAFDARWLMADRLFYWNDHLYQVVSVCPKEPTPEQVATIERFNASFHFK